MRRGSKKVTKTKTLQGRKINKKGTRFQNGKAQIKLKSDVTEIF